MTMPGHRPVRIGAVNYLNSKPLIAGLDRADPNVELILDYPSRLADGLADGLLDVALVPSIECFRHQEYRIVSDACVAARGPVLSVKLYSRVPLGKVRSLALDEGSLTSATLVQILLKERYEVQPRLEPLPLGRSSSATSADAVLLIGDRAIRPPQEQFVETWDLGDEWYRWTGLPIVFALWAARVDTPLGETEEALRRARDRGVNDLQSIAKQEAPQLGISEERAFSYLKDNLHYRLGSAEQNGLRLFQRLAAGQGLANEEVELVFQDSAIAG